MTLLDENVNGKMVHAATVVRHRRHRDARQERCGLGCQCSSEAHVRSLALERQISSCARRQEARSCGSCGATRCSQRARRARPTTRAPLPAAPGTGALGRGCVRAARRARRAAQRSLSRPPFGLLATFVASAPTLGSRRTFPPWGQNGRKPRFRARRLVRSFARWADRRPDPRGQILG